MLIFQDCRGSHICGGADDILKAQGIDSSLAKVIVTDEIGALIGAQGGNVSLQQGI